MLHHTARVIILETRLDVITKLKEENVLIHVNILQNLPFLSNMERVSSPN